ncbi:CIC11C00000003383 [Sungouiella intermedia]|uniref:CIC11C00000003383 n=1 Tax=Sungouiella intermedia TaxID=45354 RepID=A0A1L0DAD3_9ASCO|nr:CIC11C00000003383 [[Candida] intermedia]
MNPSGCLNESSAILKPLTDLSKNNMPTNLTVSDNCIEVKDAANSLPTVGLRQLPAQTEQMAKRKGGKLTLVLAGSSGTGKSTFLNTLFGEELLTKTSISPGQEVRERKFELIEDDFTLKLTAVDMPGQLDIESMKEISKRVNLIPVIARSDTLNREELGDFKLLVNNTMKAYNIEPCQFVLDQYVLGKIRAVSPYAVIGSNSFFKNADGKLVRARKYHWGIVEIENPLHCDFVQLRDILLSEHMIDLITSMESHYNQFRLLYLQERVSRSVNSLGFNYNLTPDPETDGLRSYLIYKKAKALDTIKMIDGGQDSQIEALEAESRKRLDKSIRLEETKFKQWKSSLLERQKAYNKDLENDFSKIKSLQKEIEILSPKSREEVEIIQQPTIGSDFSLNQLSF